ncbi:hypothetical protein KL86CLO1_12890 [uncultured Eubacteriales bacterium]|uniref:Uncharacterized protein n=1 Tax=uncultured Eubacteriales bacterium TaxID=172733 RepID=A0A212KEX4_9FIRM|nr:hypothetical protein KL86CLO1_12890 [uncultured Eubacteriales bacterium]
MSPLMKCPRALPSFPCGSALWQVATPCDTQYKKYLDKGMNAHETTNQIESPRTINGSPARVPTSAHGGGLGGGDRHQLRLGDHP